MNKPVNRGTGAFRHPSCQAPAELPTIEAPSRVATKLARALVPLRLAPQATAPGPLLSTGVGRNPMSHHPPLGAPKIGPSSRLLMPAPLASTSCQRFVPAYVADLRTASWAPDQLYEDFVMGLTWWGNAVVACGPPWRLFDGSV